MKRVSYSKYTKEFRQEAVKLVVDGGLSMNEASKRLSIASSTLNSWVKASKSGKLINIGGNKERYSERDIELARLRREVAELKMEREILKKAAAYLAKESL